jgi:hypothetical protein
LRGSSFEVSSCEVWINSHYFDHASLSSPLK